MRSLQPVARRILWNALRRDRAPLVSYSEGARLGVPIGLAVKTGQPRGSVGAPQRGDRRERPRRPRRAPGILQRIDDWIAEGVLGGEQLNAADLQIATSVRLLMTLQDLRDTIAARPAGELAMRVAPDYAGDAPPILPPAWLEPLRASGRRPELERRRTTALPVAERRQRLAETACRRAASAPDRARAGARARTAVRVTCGCGSVSRSVSSSRSPSSSRSTSSGRGPCRRAAEHPSPLDLDRLAGVEQLLGPSSV